MIKSSIRKFTSEFKSKVAIEALQERYSIEELSKKYDLHPSQINAWKRELKDKSANLFSSGSTSSSKTDDSSKLIDELYKAVLS